MPTADSSIPHDELLAQMGWVQSLAASLVRDPQVAQDVAQEAWLKALERPPRATSGPGLRAWLAAVTRTLARQSVRSERRRTAREHRAARPEGTDRRPEDVVARGEMHQTVVDKVMALAEPYRSTVLLRYLDDLTAPQIAERQGVSPAAVRKRLSRGLEQLRQSFDADHDGKRQAWMAAMLPFAGLSQAEAAGPFSAVLHGKAGLAMAAGLVLTAVVLLWPDGSAEELSGGGATRVAPVSDALPAPAGDDLAGSASGAVQPLEPTGAGASAASSGPRVVEWTPLHRVVRGRVVDTRGRALGDVRMRFEPGLGRASAGRGAATVTALSEPDGRFHIKAESLAGRLLAASSRWVTLYGGNATWNQGWDEQLVVVAPRQPLAGQVIDPVGQPLAGVTVSVELPEGFRTRFDGLTDASSPFVCEATTGLDGRFDLNRAPRVLGASLVARAPGFASVNQPLPEHPQLGLVFTLQPPPVVLSGRVVDARGSPAAGAHVSRGLEVALTDAAGVFRFHQVDPALPADVPLEARAVGRRLVAVKPGHQPAVLDALNAGDAVGEDPLWPADVELQLGPAPLSIVGRVVDGAGQPLSSIDVWIADPGLFALSVAASEGGGSVENSSHWSGPRSNPTPVESLAAGRPDDTWATVRTDADGRFAIEGLMDRAYTVTAHNPWTMVHASSGPVQAGATDVRLVLDGETWPRLMGRAVSRYGQPVEGVVVQPRWDAFSLGGTTFVESPPGVYAVSDADGLFLLEAVPTRDVYLRLGGKHVIGFDHGRQGEETLADLAQGGGADIVVPLRVDARIELADPAEADRATFLDAEGRPVTVSLLRFGQRRVQQAADLLEGRSEVLALSDAATTLVLQRAGVEVRRETIRLVPGNVNPLR